MAIRACIELSWKFLTPWVMCVDVAVWANWRQIGHNVSSSLSRATVWVLLLPTTATTTTTSITLLTYVANNFCWFFVVLVGVIVALLLCWHCCCCCWHCFFALLSLIFCCCCCCYCNVRFTQSKAVEQHTWLASRDRLRFDHQPISSTCWTTETGIFFLLVSCS